MFKNAQKLFVISSQDCLASTAKFRNHAHGKGCLEEGAPKFEQTRNLTFSGRRISCGRISSHHSRSCLRAAQLPWHKVRRTAKSRSVFSMTSPVSMLT